MTQSPRGGGAQALPHSAGAGGGGSAPHFSMGLVMGGEGGLIFSLCTLVVFWLFFGGGGAGGSVSHPAASCCGRGGTRARRLSPPQGGVPKGVQGSSSIPPPPSAPQFGGGGEPHPAAPRFDPGTGRGGVHPSLNQRPPSSPSDPPGSFLVPLPRAWGRRGVSRVAPPGRDPGTLPDVAGDRHVGGGWRPARAPPPPPGHIWIQFGSCSTRPRPD